MSLTLHILPYDFEVKYTPQEKLRDLVKTVATSIHQNEQKTGSYLMLLTNNARFLTIVNIKSPKDVNMENSVTYKHRNKELTDIQYLNASKGILFDPESAPYLRKVLELHKETLYNHQLYLDTKLDKYSKARDIYRRKLKAYLSTSSKIKGPLNTNIIDMDNLSKKELKKSTKKKLKKLAKGEKKLEKLARNEKKKKEKKVNSEKLSEFKKERAKQMKKTSLGKKKGGGDSFDSVQLKIHSKDPFSAVDLMNNKLHIEKT